MIEWFRADLSIRSNPKFADLGKALGIPLEFARNVSLGLVMCVLANVAEHRPTGDLHGIDDDVLETWAGWRGEPGEFALAFRDFFVSDDELTGWYDRQGKLIEMDAKKRKRDRDRKAKSKGESRGIPEESARNSAGSRVESLAHKTEQDSTRTTTAHHTAREEFLASFDEPAKRTKWVATIAGWQEGLGLAGGARATETDIEQALDEYQRNRTPRTVVNSRHVAAHVEKVIEVRKRAEMPRSFRAGVRVSAGQQGFDNADIALDALGVPRTEVHRD